MNKFLFVATTVFACAYAISDQSDTHAEVRSFTSDSQKDGSYNYQYETTNGIAGQETGQGGHYAQGSSQYYSPEGHLIQLTYSADENGFQAQGSHLPTPHPIPDEILKSLEYNRLHPEEEEEHYGEDGAEHVHAGPQYLQHAGSGFRKVK